MRPPALSENLSPARIASDDTSTPRSLAMSLSFLVHLCREDMCDAGWLGAPYILFVLADADEAACGGYADEAEGMVCKELEPCEADGACEDTC